MLVDIQLYLLGKISAYLIGTYLFFDIFKIAFF